MLVQLTQSRLAQRLMFINELQATVLEVLSIVLQRSRNISAAAFW
jgi:hypothetical protein